MAKRQAERNEGYDMISKEIISETLPKQAINAIVTVIQSGKEAIVRKENGKWVVLAGMRKLVYKEP